MLNNLKIFCYGFLVFFWKKRLAVPHFCARTINDIDPLKIKQAGCKGVILDKDDIITFNHEKDLAPGVIDAFFGFKEIFGDKLVIFSNYSGLKDKIKEIAGAQVLAHKNKKPFGVKVVKNYFGGDLSNVVMIGDRIFTDIVFGNRYGMLTILCDQLNLENRGRIDRWILNFEEFLLRRMKKKGISPLSHKLAKFSFLKP